MTRNPDAEAWDLYEAATMERPRIVYGDRCNFRPSATVGSDPFAFHTQAGVTPRAKDPVGGIRIGDDVDIYEHANIDRGLTRNTVIGDGCKIDRHVHVGHDAVLGKRVVVCAGSIIGGYVEIGDDVRIGLGAIIRNRIKVGAGARLGMGAIVIRDVPAGVVVVGNPARVVSGGPS